MPKKAVKLQWTDIQREIASKAMEGENFEALVAGGYTPSLVSKVLRSLKSGQTLPILKPETENQELGTENREPAPKAPQKVGGKTIEVGKITITPENWGFTQYGAILVLDTYNKSKRDMNYGGTVGDFICDMCELYRRMLNYKEVEYARATTEGEPSSEENGRENPERAIELNEG